MPRRCGIDGRAIWGERRGVPPVRPLCTRLNFFGLRAQIADRFRNSCLNGVIMRDPEYENQLDRDNLSPEAGEDGGNAEPIAASAAEPAVKNGFDSADLSEPAVKNGSDSADSAHRELSEDSDGVQSAPVDGAQAAEEPENLYSSAEADSVQPAVQKREESEREEEGEESLEAKLLAAQPRERLSFSARMAEAGYSVGRRYDAVKNAFLSYKSAEKRPKFLRTRFSKNSETFTVGKKLLAKLCLVSGYLRLFLALDPKAYNQQKFHHKDYTEVARYAKTPFMIKLSSDRQIRYAVELIDELMRANGFVPDESYVPKDQAGIFKSDHKNKPKVVYVGVPSAEAAESAAAQAASPIAAPIAAQQSAEDADDESDSDSDIGEPEAIDVKLPRRGRIFDKKGNRIGKLRKSVWYNEEGDAQGEFRKEETNVFLYRDDGRKAYLDSNKNVLTLDNRHIATIRTIAWLPILIIVLILAAATVLSVVLSAYFLSRSDDYAPVLFVANEDGTQWKDDENLPVFLNDTFGDNVIAPGMEGTYRFSLRNNNADALVFSLTFTEENEYGIGLQYRLKRDGVYIAGGTDYVASELLSVADMTIESDSATVFELEWRWDHNDATDTAAGENSASYTLNVAFLATIRS